MNNLKVQNLSVTVKTRVATELLRDISLEMPFGDSLCVLANSGAGKTTLLNSLARVYPEKASVSGSIDLPGLKKIETVSHTEIMNYRKKHIGTMFQDARGSFIPHVSVGVQLSRIYRYRRELSKQDAKKLVLERLSDVGFDNPESVYAKPVSSLSGGMASRCALISALSAPELRLLLLDEPTGSLDGKSAATTLKLIKELSTNKPNIILVTHDVRFSNITDRVLVLKNGSLEEFTGSEKFNTRPESNEGRELVDNWHSLQEIGRL